MIEHLTENHSSSRSERVSPNASSSALPKESVSESEFQSLLDLKVPKIALNFRTQSCKFQRRVQTERSIRWRNELSEKSTK